MKFNFSFGNSVCFDLNWNGSGVTFYGFAMICHHFFLNLFEFFSFALISISNICLVHVYYTHTIRMNLVYKWWIVWLFRLFLSFFLLLSFRFPSKIPIFLTRQMKFICILYWMVTFSLFSNQKSNYKYTPQYNIYMQSKFFWNQKFITYKIKL